MTAPSRSVGRCAWLRAAPDDVLDAVLGVPRADDGWDHRARRRSISRATCGARLVGGRRRPDDRVEHRIRCTGRPVGRGADAAPVTFDHLDLQVVADGRHSVPTQLRIDAGGESRTVDVGPVTDRADLNATASIPVSFPPLTGSDVRVTVTAIRPMTTIEYHENQPIVMPVAIAELGIPGVIRPPTPVQLPSECRTDLLSVDGAPVALRLSGGTAKAQRGEAVDFEPCADPLSLAEGDHLVRSTPGTSTGIDVDGVVLASDATGAPGSLGPGGSLANFTPSVESVPAGTPDVRVVDDGRTNKELRISGAEPGVPFWLVLGESNSKGWKASVANDDASVLSGPGAGRSTLVDGYANGWLVVPNSPSFNVALEWTPQRSVWVALAISGAALLGCVASALWPCRRVEDRDDDKWAALDGQPDLANPFVADGATSRGPGLVGATLVAGLTAAFLARGGSASSLRPVSWRHWYARVCDRS